jgi:ribosome-binding protein aMBF1 (putative translation factor)
MQSSRNQQQKASESMSVKEYFEERAARDPAFREARAAQRAGFEFRRALIGARLASGLTQAELAERIGTTQSAIARLESGGAKPSFDMLGRLAAALHVSFEIMPTLAVELHAQPVTPS